MATRLGNVAGSSGSYLLYRKVDAMGIQNTVTVNPTTVLTVGFGFNRFPNDTQDISNGFDQATLGFPSSYYLAADIQEGIPSHHDRGKLPSEPLSSVKAHRIPGPVAYFLAQLRGWCGKEPWKAQRQGGV